MQDVNGLYRVLMRFGSLSSLCLLLIGLIYNIVFPNIPDGWNWSSGYSYLMLGLIVMLLTPVAGLITFFIHNIKIKQYAMAILVVILLALLAGGTWLIHPGN